MPPAGTGHVRADGPFGFRTVSAPNRQLRIAGNVLVLQPIVRRVMATRWDGVIVALNLRLPASLLLAALFKARGRTVIAWGHGFERATDDPAPVERTLRLAARFKAWFARRVDGYLVYNERGAEALAAAGVPPVRIHPVRNTIDVGEQAALRQELESADPAELRAELGFGAETAVLLLVGRLYREKRAIELIEAIRSVRKRRPELPVEVVVIGDGPELERTRAAAAGLAGIHFRGAVYDPKVLARHLRVASAMVIPGAAGLAVNHAFAHGVPVVTRESASHAPEVDYIEDGVNGLVVRGDLDRFAAAIAGLLASPERQRTLAAGALETSSQLSLEQMVRAFDRGVAASLGWTAPGD